jgi:ribonuclease HI
VTPRPAKKPPARRPTQAPLRVIVHVDGGSRGNPGPAAAGVVVSCPDGVVLHEAGLYLGRATNNVAEYRGLLAGLEAAKAMEAAEVQVLSDSELLVRQMNGEYRVRNAALQPLHEQALGLAEKFAACTFRHIRREKNLRADELVNRSINLRRDVSGTD